MSANPSQRMRSAAWPAEDLEPGVGSQILLDLYECASHQLDSVAWVKRALLKAAREAEATVVQTVFHKFAPWGISGVVVLAESHLAIHIWPERRFAAIDLFTCGARVRPQRACDFLVKEFQSARPLQHSFARGSPPTRLRSASQALPLER